MLIWLGTTGTHKLRVDIHIGAPKAGSTAIQQFLAANRRTLEEAGLRIISLNRPEFRDVKRSNDDFRWIPHWPFMRQRKNRRFFQEIRERISNSAQHRGVISSEYLFQLKNEAIIRLFKNVSFRRTDELRLLLYVRDPVSTKRAMYSTAIRLGSVVPYSHYKEPSFTLNIHDRINMWRRVFGDYSLAVKLYSRDQFPGGDIKKCLVKHLISDGLVELNLSGLDYTKGRSNASLKPSELEILRALNKANRTLAKPLAGDELGTCQMKWLEYAKTQISLPEHSWSEPNLSRFLSRCRQQNQSVMQEYFPALEQNWIENQSTAYLDKVLVNDRALKETFTVAQNLLTQRVKGEPVLKLIGINAE